jgi:AcrR family transcriptional regulator
MGGHETERPNETLGRIIDAGILTFARYGFRRAGMDLVADEAKVSRQTLYNHVPNKSALFLAVVEALQRRSMAAAEAALVDGRSAKLSGACLLAQVLMARLGYFQDVLRGSMHVAELTDEQNLQCGAVIVEHRNEFRSWLIDVVEQERRGGAFPGQMLGSDAMVDDALCVALGVKISMPRASSAEHRVVLERLLLRVIG